MAVSDIGALYAKTYLFRVVRKAVQIVRMARGYLCAVNLGDSRASFATRLEHGAPRILVNGMRPSRT